MAKLIRQNLEAKLAALGGAEWDSMSEDSDHSDHSDGDTHDALAPPPLPLRAQRKGKKKGKGATGSVVPVGPAGQPSGVVYIGHIPHGFYEEAMNGFFKQFGDVVRVRVSRSKRSGRCKVSGERSGGGGMVEPAVVLRGRLRRPSCLKSAWFDILCRYVFVVYWVCC